MIGNTVYIGTISQKMYTLKLWQQEESRCESVLSCIFVFKSICSFIMLNFEFNLLYRLKINMLSNYSSTFSFATQPALKVGTYKYNYFTIAVSLWETSWSHIVSVFLSSLDPSCLDSYPIYFWNSYLIFTTTFS